MKIQISDNIIKYYLRNVYFINGQSYAGKSTMVKMLAERYNMVFCCENYQSGMPDSFPKNELSRWKTLHRKFYMQYQIIAVLQLC